MCGPSAGPTRSRSTTRAGPISIASTSISQRRSVAWRPAGNEILSATANFGRVSFTRNLGNIVMDLNGVEAIDVNALGGTDTVTVDDVTGTDLVRVNVDLAAALGGLAADGQADAVIVKGTNGDDSIAANASGAAVEVRGLADLVRITHADPAADRLTIDTLAGADAVRLDPAVAALILVSIL